MSNSFLIGVVADDITGANDIGVMFSKYGFVTKVYTINTKWDISSIEADILIIDTDSRFDLPEIAYEKVRKATTLLNEAGCQLFINKTCSVFRGNIGAEFDAMVDTLELEFAPIVLGFPKNGRYTKNGIHFVNGSKLDDSEFSRDPIHPMTDSSLQSILEKQTEKKVSILTHDIIHAGENELAEKIRAKKEQHTRYLLFDVTSQDDLKKIAKELVKDKAIFGSSAIAEEIAPLLVSKRKKLVTRDFSKFHTNKSVLLLAGSVTPQSRAQINSFKESGHKFIEIDSLLLLDETTKHGEIERVLRESESCLKREEPLLLYITNEPKDVAKTQKLGEELQLSKSVVGQIISATLSQIAHVLVESGLVNKLIIAGGDTSGAICRGLGVKGLEVLEEIEAGLPSCRVVDGTYDLLLVLKSGSFGKSDFFLTAINHLYHLEEG